MVSSRMKVFTVEKAFDAKNTGERTGNVIVEEGAILLRNQFNNRAFTVYRKMVYQHIQLYY